MGFENHFHSMNSLELCEETFTENPLMICHHRNSAEPAHYLSLIIVR